MASTSGSNGKGSLRRPESTPGRYAEGWAEVFGPRAKTAKRGRKTGECGRPYPSWVCSDCATKAGGRLLDPESTTTHTGDCEVCGMPKAVTQPRDYGYPRFK